MPAVVFAIPKGGSGKTTSAIVFGTEVARNGVPVVMIDADPNQTLTAWWKQSKKSGKVPENITVVTSDEVKARLRGEGGSQPETAAQIIMSHNIKGTMVVVDVEGVADLVMADAINVANLLVIPMKPMKPDFDGLKRILARIRTSEDQLSQVIGRKHHIKHAVLVTQLRSQSILGTGEREIIEAVRESGIKMISTMMLLRSAYAGLHIEGGDLATLNPQGNGNIKSALDEAGKIATDIMTVLKEPVPEAAE